MDLASFRSAEAGRVIKTPQGYGAFVPAIPPPRITYDPALALLLSEADAALSELSGLGRVVPNPDLLIAPYVKREAVASSRIEGTQADLSDLLLDEIEPRRTPPGSDVYEIRNYVAALNLGMRKLATLSPAAPSSKAKPSSPSEIATAKCSSQSIGPSPCSTVSSLTHTRPSPERQRSWELHHQPRKKRSTSWSKLKC